MEAVKSDKANTNRSSGRSRSRKKKGKKSKGKGEPAKRNSSVQRLKNKLKGNGQSEPLKTLVIDFKVVVVVWVHKKEIFI